MADIIITVVSGETTNLGLSIPGVQGPMGQSTLPSGGSVGQIITKQGVTDYDAAWTSSVSGLTLYSSIASGLTLQGAISGGIFITPTISGATFSGTTINAGTISGGSYAASSISGATIYASTLSGNTIDIASGIFSSPSLISPIVSGSIAASGAVTILASGDSAGFFGASPVLCPSGIVIPSGGSSTEEVLTALSGVIVALQSLGLVRG